MAVKNKARVVRKAPRIDGRAPDPVAGEQPATTVSGDAEATAAVVSPARRMGILIDRPNLPAPDPALVYTERVLDVFGNRSKLGGCMDEQLIPVLGCIFRELRVSRADAERLQSNETTAVDGWVRTYVEVTSDRFPTLRFGLGDRAGGAKVTILRAGGRALLPLGCQWRLGGAISLLLPTAGMSRVGQLRASHLISNEAARTARRQLIGDPTRLKDLLRAATANPVLAFPLGSSLLYYRRGTVSFTIDLDDTVYRVANSGLLVSFESLSVRHGDGAPQVNFRGGRLWKTA